MHAQAFKNLTFAQIQLQPLREQMPMKSKMITSVSNAAGKAAELAPRVMEERRRMLEAKLTNALHERNFDLNELSGALAHSQCSFQEIMSLFRMIVENSAKMSSETKAVLRDGIAAQCLLIEKAETKEERELIGSNLIDLCRMAREQDESDKRHSKHQTNVFAGVLIFALSMGGFVVTKGKIKPRFG
ncbi:MAG: hypothetical protein ACF788_10540 [Novipirellula sp. JB048]